MTKPAQILKDVKGAIREPYAWPGGYPKYILMADGEALSVEAARENWRRIAGATIGRQNDGGWQAAGVDVNWEDVDLVCAHTGDKIESAYGED